MYSLMVENLPGILANRRSHALYKLIDVRSVTNVIGESISSIPMWSIVNQSGKYDSFLVSR